MSDWIRAIAPATVANVGSGFDVCGFALQAPADEVRARVVDRPGVHLVEMDGACEGIPLDPARNTATVAALSVLRNAARDGIGVELSVHKGIAPGSGIGSSAASSVAAAVAVAGALGLRTGPSDLLAAAIDGEAAASGFGHADNVAPALTGGFVLVDAQGTITSISVPRTLFCALIHPRMQVDTRGARAVLPDQVPLSDVVRQVGNCASLVAGLLTDNDRLLASGLHDVIAEPRRAHLTPGFAAVQAAAVEAGAIGCSLSGSGPSIFALCRGRELGDRVAARMAEVMRHESGVEVDVYVSGPNASGARRLG